MANNTLDQDEIRTIRSEADQMASGESIAKLTKLYERYEEIYFMTAVEGQPRGNKIDPNDWKVTVSPSGRNAVTGMKRLLDTSEIHVKITEDGDASESSDKIEKALLRILSESGALRIARVEKDLNLSAVLYGPTVLTAESVKDLINLHKTGPERRVVEDIAKRTPFLIRTINPRESFSRWGEYGMSAHLRRYKATGAAIQERWGKTGLKSNNIYWIRDWMDNTNRVVWIEGQKEELLAMPHKMHGMNTVARFAGGSSLFTDSDKVHQSFLYAHTKGEWDKRENLFWTYLFTALFLQGLPGPLLIIDPDSVQNNQVEIDFTGGVRKIFGRAQATNFPVIDGDVLRIKELMDATHAESTIYKQTLGQNIAGSTFSGLSMLSSAGQLPLEDPKEAIGFTFRDIFTHILNRIKDEGLDTPWISAEDIPDTYEMEVTLEPKLPQDNLRNAQIAQQLGTLVSDEWKRQHLLQIGDSAAMTKQVAKEQMLTSLIGAMMQDQERVKLMIDNILGPAQPPRPPAGIPTPGKAMAPGGPGGMPPEGMPPGAMPQGAMPQGAMPPGEANMAQPEMTGPMEPLAPGQVPGA